MMGPLEISFEKSGRLSWHLAIAHRWSAENLLQEKLKLIFQPLAYTRKRWNFISNVNILSLFPPRRAGESHIIPFIKF